MLLCMKFMHFMITVCLVDLILIWLSHDNVNGWVLGECAWLNTLAVGFEVLALTTLLPPWYSLLLIHIKQAFFLKHGCIFLKAFLVSFLPFRCNRLMNRKLCRCWDSNLEPRISGVRSDRSTTIARIVSFQPRAASTCR